MVTQHGILKLIQSSPRSYCLHGCIIAFDLQTMYFVVVLRDDGISLMEFIDLLSQLLLGNRAPIRVI